MDTPEVKATPIVLSPESRSSGRRVWGVRYRYLEGPLFPTFRAGATNTSPFCSCHGVRIFGTTVEP